MTPETFLAIASFALSLGGILPVFFLREQRKAVVLAMVIAALIGTTGATLIRLYKHEQLISRIQQEVINELGRETLTFDQLYIDLHYVPFPVLNEALFRAVEEKRVAHRIIEFQKDATIVPVRGYYVPSD